MILSLLLAADVVQTLEAAHSAYDRCVQEQTVKLGAANGESADTILTAVRAQCNPEFMAMVRAFPGATAASPEMLGWRRDSEGRAVAALLAARAGRP